MKKFIIILSMSIALIGSIYFYIQYNLVRYSVYYASHMPRKEGAKPELIMALENTNFIDKQNTENVHFEEEDSSTIYLNGNEYFASNYGGYYLRVGKQDGLHFYYTDLTGKFVSQSSLEGERKPKPIDEDTLQEIEGKLVPTTKDLIKAQKTPTINLQGLFNQKYEARFNE